jgi:putative ABC transport system ATP-binding protein
MKAPVLELRHVTKTYTLGDEKFNALNDVSFVLKEGDFVAVMGPSGSGKSTFLHVSSFLDSPTSGEIILKGTRIEKFKEKELAVLRNREIGFIFQQFNLLERTSALDNVELPLIYASVKPEERIRRATEALEQVGLSSKLKNTRAQLSGGQQQRVAIARALVTNPSIIFADEPTGNLDSQSSKDVMELLTSLHKHNKTILMVTHEEDIAKYANKVIHMRDGKILARLEHHKEKKTA